MNFLLAIAVIAALVWGMAFALRGSLIAGCLTFLVLTVCFGHEFFNFDLGPLPLTIDRLWIGFLAAMYVVQWRRRRTHPKAMTWAELALFGFVGLVTISALLNEPFKSTRTGPPIWHLFVGYIFPVILYWVARQSSLTEKRVVAVHAFLAVFGIYLALTGIFEMTGQWSLVFPAYIADPAVGLHFGRARGPMAQSVSYGLYLGICIAATLVWQLRVSRPAKLVLFGCVALELVAVGLTLTRSVWIGTALILLVLAAFMLKDAWRKLVLFGMVAGALLVVGTRFDRLTGFQREGTVEDTRSSAESRASFAYVSWKMFLDKPILGIGFGRFPEAKLPYLSDRTTDLNLELIRPLAHHNTYLSLLTELGIIGLGLYVVVLGLWTRYAWQLYRSQRRPPWAKTHGVLSLCALATYAVQMLFHDVTYTAIDNSILFLLAGMTIGLNYSGKESRRANFGRLSDRANVRPQNDSVPDTNGSAAQIGDDDSAQTLGVALSHDRRRR